MTVHFTEQIDRDYRRYPFRIIIHPLSLTFEGDSGGRRTYTPLQLRGISLVDQEYILAAFKFLMNQKLEGDEQRILNMWKPYFLDLFRHVREVYRQEQVGGKSLGEYRTQPFVALQHRYRLTHPILTAA